MALLLIDHDDDARCLHCQAPAGAAFYAVTRQPGGDVWTVCSLPCLLAFVKGGDPLPAPALSNLLYALLAWRAAKAKSAAERRAGAWLAQRSAELLRLADVPGVDGRFDSGSDEDGD